MSWLFLWCIATYTQWICNILFPSSWEESNRVFHSLSFKATFSQHLPLDFFRVIAFMSQHMLPSVFSVSFIWCFSSFPSASLPIHIFLLIYMYMIFKKKSLLKPVCEHESNCFSATCMPIFWAVICHCACLEGSVISAAWFNQIPQLCKNFYSRILHV